MAKAEENILFVKLIQEALSISSSFLEFRNKIIRLDSGAQSVLNSMIPDIENLVDFVFRAYEAEESYLWDDSEPYTLWTPVTWRGRKAYVKVSRDKAWVCEDPDRVRFLDRLFEENGKCVLPVWTLEPKRVRRNDG